MVSYGWALLATGHWTLCRCWWPLVGRARVKAAQVSPDTSGAAAWTPFPGSSSLLPTATLCPACRHHTRKRTKDGGLACPRRIGTTNTSLWTRQGAQDNKGSPQCPSHQQSVVESAISQLLHTGAFVSTVLWEVKLGWCILISIQTCDLMKVLWRPEWKHKK